MGKSVPTLVTHLTSTCSPLAICTHVSPTRKSTTRAASGFRGFGVFWLLLHPCKTDSHSLPCSLSKPPRNLQSNPTPETLRAQTLALALPCSLRKPPRNLQSNPNPEALQTHSRTKAPRERCTQSLTNASNTHNANKHQANQGPLSSSTPWASEASLLHLSLPKRSRCTRSDCSDATPSQTGTALPPCVLKLRRRNLKGVYSKLFTDSKDLRS